MRESHERPQSEPATLREALEVIAGLSHVIQELSAEKAKLHERSMHDVLIPSMLNKEATTEAIEAYVAEDEAFGLWVIDLDNFKQVNDLYGHLAGDDALIAVGSLLDKYLKRSTDVVGAVQGRFGGDEFVVMAKIGKNGRRSTDLHTQMDNIYALIRLAEIEFLASNNLLDELNIGFSIGSAMYDPDNPVDARTLFEQADEAVFEEKPEGRRR